MHTTHSSVVAGGANGLSSGEEPNGVDLSLVTFEPHHTLPGATVPDTRSTVTTLTEHRGKLQNYLHQPNYNWHCIRDKKNLHCALLSLVCVYLTYCCGKHSEWILWIQSQPVCVEMCRQRCRRAKAKQTSQLYTPRQSKQVNYIHPGKANKSTIYTQDSSLFSRKKEELPWVDSEPTTLCFLGKCSR